MTRVRLDLFLSLDGRSSVAGDGPDNPWARTGGA